MQALKPYFDRPIIIADHTSATRSFIRQGLVEVGFRQVIEVESGDRLINLLSSRKVGAVICDWDLTGKDGLEVLRTMRDSERYIITPFIMTVAAIDKKHIGVAAESGISDLLIKPIKLSDLLDKLKSAFRTYAIAEQRLR